MDDLLRQVSRARRRLVVEQFVRRLTPCLSVAFLLATLGLALPRVVTIEGLPDWWDAAWLIGSIATGFAAAAVWTAARQRSDLDAAIEIDKRYGLRARVASSLSLPDSERGTEIGQALVDDAVRSVTRIDVDEKFRVRPGRFAWAPLVPALVAALLIGFVGNRQAKSNTTKKPAEATKAEIKKSVEELRKKIAERRKRAEEKDLKDATGLLKQIEQGAKELNDKTGADKRKTLVKLNDLKQQLDKRRQELGGKKALEQQLKGLKDLGKGPAEKAADAIRKGDFKKAVDEIQKMQQQLAKGELNKEQQQQLAEQLGKMKERLEQAVENRQQAMDELKRQINEQRQQGNAEKANELQQKLDKLQQQQQRMDQLQKLAEKMGQAQQAAQQGDQQQAADAMKQMAEQLEQMQQQANEMEMLGDAMDLIEAAKEGLAGDQPGDGMGPMPGQWPGWGDGEGDQPGMGMGKGQGTGPRPDEANDTAMRDTRVRQNPGKGASVMAGQVDGPNIKGNVGEAIKQEIAGGIAEESDPLVEERLPRGHREHAQEFFQQLREGL
ncbi:MAG: hypothetical protein AAGG46_01005 [Planctomycetota bacterium]